MSVEARITALVRDFSTSLDEFEASARKHLAEHFGCDAVYFATIGPNFVEHSPFYFQQILRDPHRFDPGQRKAREIVARFGPAFIDTEAYTAVERDRLPTFRELLRPAGISSVILAMINLGDRTTGMIHLVRSARQFRGDALVGAQPLLRALAIMHHAIVGLPPGESHASSEAAAGLVARLSRRELQVATLAADGYGAIQIAARLGTSNHTVRRQLEAIYRKLGIGNRVELTSIIQDARYRLGDIGHTTDGASAHESFARILGSLRLHPAVRFRG